MGIHKVCLQKNGGRISMNTEHIRTVTDLAYVVNVLGGGRVPVKYRYLGHYIRSFSNSGPVGGVLSQVFTDAMGTLQSTSITLSSILGCGHLINSVEQISGFCHMCARVCCPQCLALCDFTGMTVCRRHYAVVHGVVVSSRAQKGLWKHKARKLAKQRRELPYETKPRPTFS